MVCSLSAIYWRSPGSSCTHSNKSREILAQAVDTGTFSPVLDLWLVNHLDQWLNTIQPPKSRPSPLLDPSSREH